MDDPNNQNPPVSPLPPQTPPPADQPNPTYPNPSSDFGTPPPAPAQNFSPAWTDQSIPSTQEPSSPNISSGYTNPYSSPAENQLQPNPTAPPVGDLNIQDPATQNPPPPLSSTSWPSAISTQLPPDQNLYSQPNPSPEVKEPAPTDLSHIAALAPENPSANVYNPTPQTPENNLPSSPTPGPAPETTQKPKDSKLNLIIIVGGGISVLAVLAASIYFFFLRASNAPAPTSEPAVSQQAPLTNPPAIIQRPTLPPPVQATAAGSPVGPSSFGEVSPSTTPSASASGKPTSSPKK